MGWSAGSKRNCVTGLPAVFNWARKSKLIPENPLEGIERDPSTSRGSEALIGNDAAEIEANHQMILAASPRRTGRSSRRSRTPGRGPAN